MGRVTPWKYVKDQFTTLPNVSEYATDLTGKTVVVVGANIGLGLETARHFARMNPKRLIMACRNMEKAQTALKSVQESTKCQNLEAWYIDLADFKTIRAFADKYEDEGGGHLDLLVMNAGVNSFTYKRTVDNWELMLQTNYLGTSYLTLLLLPYLKKSPLSTPTPRIVIVSSEAHYLLPKLVEADDSHILEKLNDENYNVKQRVMWERYYITKLFSIFFVRSLASRLPCPSSEAPGLVVTTVNPGWCRSEINREVRWTLRGCIIWALDPILGRSNEVGSRTIVWAALAGKDGGAEVHGRYTATCRVEEESNYALSPEGSGVEVRVWRETVEVLNKIDSRVGGIIQEHLDRP